jgi:hypothetical protein
LLQPLTGVMTAASLITFVTLVSGWVFARRRTVSGMILAARAGGGKHHPSCQSRRLAEWSLWLDEQLLAPVPHRQVMLTLPKLLRAYFIYDRRRLGLLSRLAFRTLRGYLQAAIGERDAVPGVIACVPTLGALAHRHPHRHVLLTDGAFRRDGRFVPAATHNPGVLTEVVRGAVLSLFVRAGWLEEDAAAAILAWPHSGFSAHAGPRIEPEDREGLLWVARYSARAPVAESRLRDDAERAEVQRVSERSDGPYAGVHRGVSGRWRRRGT